MTTKIPITPLIPLKPIPTPAKPERKPQSKKREPQPKKEKPLYTAKDIPLYGEHLARTEQRFEAWATEPIPMITPSSETVKTKPIDKIGVDKIGEHHETTTQRLPPFTKGIVEGALFSIPELPAFIANIVTQPLKTAKKTAKYARTHPAEFTGQLLGASIAGKAVGRGVRATSETIKFTGKTRIPAEKIVPKDVLEGKETFPTHKGTAGELFAKYKTGRGVTPEIATQLTEQKYLGFHATPEAGGVRGLSKSFEVTGEYRPTKVDVPGLHMAPRISPHFLRLPLEGYEPPRLKLPSFKNIFKNIGKKKGTLAVGFERIGRLPPGTVEEGISSVRTFLREGAERGKAYTTYKAERGLQRGGEIEAEVVLSPRTRVVPVDDTALWKRLLGREAEYYTEIRGRKVPIHRVRALEENSGRGGRVVSESESSGVRSSALGELADRYVLPEREPLDFYPVTPPVVGSVRSRSTLQSQKKALDFSTYGVDEKRRERKGERLLESTPVVREPVFRESTPPVPRGEEKSYTPSRGTTLSRGAPFSEPAYSDVLFDDVFSLSPVKEKKGKKRRGRKKKRRRSIDEELASVYREWEHPTLTPEEVFKL